jgi:hypothetical protein
MNNIKYHALTIFAFATLLVNGCHAQAPVDSKLSPNGSITSIRTMNTQRATHTATLLDKKKVLIAGGFVNGGGSIADVEVYDGATQTFSAIVKMSVARSSHSATSLPNGKILIAGGYNGEYLDSAELYNPETNKFEPAGKMTMARSGHIATLLKDGTVLLAGGVGTGWTFLASAEIYDPKTNRFSATDAMSVERESHTSNLLPDGRVLITGGHKGRRAAITIYRSAEIFDPKRKAFAPVGDLNTKRHKHEAVLLDDGRVLVIGGSDEQDGLGAYKNAEVFDPKSNSFKPINQTMTQARYKLQGTVVKLSDGRILIAGGSDRAEIFNPLTNSFTIVEGVMDSRRLFATATLLGNGQVLIAGGYHTGSNNVSNGAWIFKI